MMFTGITIAFGLIALATGIALCIWAMRNEGKGVRLAKIVGFIISFVAVLIIVSSVCMTIFGLFGMKKMMAGGCPMCNMMQQDKSKTSMMPHEIESR